MHDLQRHADRHTVLIGGGGHGLVQQQSGVDEGEHDEIHGRDRGGVAVDESMVLLIELVKIAHASQGAIVIRTMPDAIDLHGRVLPSGRRASGPRWNGLIGDDRGRVGRHRNGDQQPEQDSRTHESHRRLHRPLVRSPLSVRVITRG